MCKQTIDKFGDHATCCTKNGDTIIRHNGIRDLVGDIANDGMLSPVLAKKGILGNTTGRRPGDVTFARWTEGKGLAIDVAVMSPLASTYLRMKEPCEWYAATQKHGKYDESFIGTDHIFCAMVFETLGAVNAEGEDVLRMIFRFAAKRLDGNLLPLVDELGHDSRAICNARSHNQFLLESTVKIVGTSEYFFCF